MLPCCVRTAVFFVSDPAAGIPGIVWFLGCVLHVLPVGCCLFGGRLSYAAASSNVRGHYARATVHSCRKRKYNQIGLP